jgi:hypothetical protein
MGDIVAYLAEQDLDPGEGATADRLAGVMMPNQVSIWLIKAEPTKWKWTNP